MRTHHQLSFIDLSVKYFIPNNDPLKILFESINFNFIYNLVKDKYSPKGSHGYNPVSLFKALLLIYLGFASSERDLAKKLRFDARLSYLCGFPFGNTPSHATFHYFRKRLGQETFYHILLNLIAQSAALILDKKLSLSIDSTHIEAFKSDKDAKIGVKKVNFFFYGYKIHVIVTNTGPPIPLSIEVTPGNKNDGVMLKPLIEKTRKVIPEEKKITELCADAAYDSVDNHSVLLNQSITPYIAENRRGRKNPVFRGDVRIDSKGNIVCKAGKKLLNWGYEKRRKRYKFRCPLIKSGESCPYQDSCWRSNYGPVFYLHEGQGVMERVRVIRNRADFKERYKRRATIERFFSIMKRGQRIVNVRVRGIEEIGIHVIMGMVAYIMRVIAGYKVGVGFLRV